MAVVEPISESGMSDQFPIVGIGASAGGLESLEQFFTNLPSATGMAFVVVQHLSPDFRSMMDELLGRHSDMPVQLAEHNVLVEPNHVYLLPPGKEITIRDRRLQLNDKERIPVFTLPIDLFFQSLAADVGPAAVAIILSGSGSDGSRGIGAIKRAGGRVFAESPESASFDGMPMSALATGLVDRSGPASALPQFVLQTITEAIHSPDPEEPIDEAPMDTVLRLLRDHLGIDFSMYKTTTVTRRVLRRVEMLGAQDLSAYVTHLRMDPSELSSLYHDLLIGVTQFFRDPKAFEFLEKNVIPDLLKRVPESEELRLWVAGCATGEEAYSLAILLHEQITAADRTQNVKILSTDVHAASLAHASAGIYQEEQLANVSAERRERYFAKKPNGYHISQDLRQMIVFAPHNVTKDAPFTKMHFISCRNFLIYLEPHAQKSVLLFFHFGLVTGGILFLGSSESAGALSTEFETIDEHSKIYRKRRDVRLLEPLQIPHARKAPTPGKMPSGPTRVVTADPQLMGMYDQLLNKYMPPSFLIDENHELVDSFGGAEKLFQLKARRPSMNILDLLNGDLRTIVAGAVQRALKNRDIVRYTGVRIPEGDAWKRCVLSAQTMTNPRTGASHVLISVEHEAGESLPEENSTPVGEVATAHASDERMATLEGELSYTRETLQSAIEELQTSNEELQSTNEELVASNEELQSTNEELHSVNEELYTVNAELQKKIVELRELNSDMQHFLESTDVAILFLDSTLAIRKYTPRIASIFHLEPQDTGRSIRHFTHNLTRPELQSEIERTLRDGGIVEDEVRGHDGTIFFMRIFPYHQIPGIETDSRKTRPAKAEGVVVSLTDISALNTARTRLEERETQIRLLLDSTAEAIIGLGPDGRCTFVNPSCVRILGFRSSEQLVGQHVHDLVHSDYYGADHTRENCSITSVLRTGEGAHHDDEIFKRADRSSFVSEYWSYPIRDREGLAGVVVTFLDITERKRNEDEIRAASKRREEFLAMLSHELRNPLATVISAAAVSHEPAETPEKKDRANRIIERQARHMARLLDDLLDVSRITRGSIELQKSIVDVRDVIRVSLETLQPVFSSRSSRLESDIADTPLPVNGDADRLQQVVVNLLSNAARYSPPDAPIHLSAKLEGDSVVLRVKDSGSGIPKEMLEEIFELFVQNRQGLERSKGGMGIGLTLVRTIVELHGGTVEAVSDGIGLGSEFVVRLPRQHAAVVPRPATPKPEIEPCRIVIVEDQDDAREMMAYLLAMKGHEVIDVADGLSALEAIDAKQPDIVFVDIGLPVLNGYEVAKRVRSNPSLAHVVLVALTGYGQSEDVQKARAAGFDEHLTKPAEPDAIEKVLGEWIYRKRSSPFEKEKRA